MYKAGGDRVAGQPFYLQLRSKTNCSGVAGTNGGGRKVFSVSRTENSYTVQEIVAQDTYYRGVFQMYQGMGAGGTAYLSFEEHAGAYDFNFQPGSAYAKSPGYCSYTKVKAGDRTDCWLWGDNQWTTYLMYVSPAANQTANGAVTVWAWRPGMPDYVKIMDKQNLWMTYQGTDSLGNTLAPGFNAALLWIYETGRTGGPSGQKQWYDQVILSKNHIACPTA